MSAVRHRARLDVSHPRRRHPRAVRRPQFRNPASALPVGRLSPRRAPFMIPRFSHALRSLKRAPLFSVTVILALTIGLGSAAAIFAIVNGVLLRPLPYGHPDRLVGVWHDMPSLSMHHAPQTPGTYFTYKRLAKSL